MTPLEIRRRAMATRSGGSSGYVTNGLVLQLDGIDKGTTDTTKWVDLVGGITFTEQNGNDCHGTNCIIFDSNNYLLGDSKLDNIPTASCTIEAAIYSKPQGWSSILIFDKNSVGMLINADSYVCNSNSFKFKTNYRYVYQSINLIWSFAGGTRAFENGVSMTIVNGGWNAGIPSSPIIGALNTSGSYKNIFNIYAIRVYNRLLSEAEILNNQQIDNERFALGLTLTS